MKDQYLDYLAIKSHAIQVKAIKDQKESKDGLKVLLNIFVSTDILSWIDKCNKHFCKLSGKDFTPLAYLIGENAEFSVTTDDLLP